MRCFRGSLGHRAPRWVWMQQKLLAVYPPLRSVLHPVFVRKPGFQRELSSAPTP